MQRNFGFTLTELLISAALSCLVLSMAALAFNAVMTTTRQAQQLAELQQNAQLLLSLFNNELANTGFWGGRSAPELALMHALPDRPAPDCVKETLDSGSFPQVSIPFVTLYAEAATAGRQLSCLTNLLPDTEILQLKRLIGAPTLTSELRQNRFYLETDWQHSRFVTNDSPELNEQHLYFPYQHLVFYLQQQRVDGQMLPVLMRKRLTRNQAGRAVISTDSVLDGVERMHFEFGVDTDADGQVNYVAATEQIPVDIWQQSNSKIISLTYHLLLRSRQPDPHFVNQQQYRMGQHQFEAPGDHYRRMLVSSSIYFPNVTLKD